MNRTKIFIVSSVLLLILVVILFSNPKTKDVTEQKEQTEQTKIISENPDDLTTITLIEEENYVYRKVEGVWVTDLSDKLKIDQELFNSYAIKLSSLKPIMVIAENATDEQKKEYGLDHEHYIGLKYKNGNEYLVAIGSSSPAANGEYVILKDSTTIYLVSSDDLFLFYMFPNEYIYKGVDPKPDFKNLTDIKIEYQDGTIYDIKKSDDKLYHMSKPIDFDLDYDKLNLNLIASLEKLNFYSYETENDKTYDYGFDNPTLNITLKDSNDVSLNLVVGKQVDEYSYAATYNDSTAVYSMLSEVVKPLLDLQVSSLINNVILSHDILNIKNVYANYKGTEYNYDIVTHNGELMDGLLNGEKIFTEKIKFAVTKMQELSIDSILSYYDDVELLEPDVHIKYTLDDGKVFEYKCYDYNQDYYIVLKDDKKYGLISKSQVEIIFNTIKSNQI